MFKNRREKELLMELKVIKGFVGNLAEKEHKKSIYDYAKKLRNELMEIENDK